MSDGGKYGRDLYRRKTSEEIYAEMERNSGPRWIEKPERAMVIRAFEEHGPLRLRYADGWGAALTRAQVRAVRALMWHHDAVSVSVNPEDRALAADLFDGWPGCTIETGTECPPGTAEVRPADWQQAR
jgi:hypothetical protein